MAEQSFAGLRRGRFLALIAPPARTVLLALLCVLGCDDSVHIKNVAPRVTRVGPVSAIDAGLVSVELWVRDKESDPVDVAFAVLSGGKEKDATAGPGGHGDLGLPSSPELTGTRHIFVWDAGADGFEPGDSVRLRLEPTDFEGKQGEAMETPEFKLANGLPWP